MRPQHRIGEQPEHQVAVAREKLSLHLNGLAPRRGLKISTGIFHCLDEGVSVSRTCTVREQIRS